MTTRATGGKKQSLSVRPLGARGRPEHRRFSSWLLLGARRIRPAESLVIESINTRHRQRGRPQERTEPSSLRCRSDTAFAGPKNAAQSGRGTRRATDMV
jgi:hypothetical protein